MHFYLRLTIVTCIIKYIFIHVTFFRDRRWLWLYGSLINIYLWQQLLSTLKLRLWIQIMARCTRYNIIWSLLEGRWLASSTDRTGHHNMSEILLKVALNTENLLLVYLSDWYAVSHFRLIDAVLKSSEHYFRYTKKGIKNQKTTK